MATHSSILAWEILWAEQPGRWQTKTRPSAHTGNFTFVDHFVFSKFSISMNLIYMIKMMECITKVLN